jgi:charged multivesicular body protein 7
MRLFTGVHYWYNVTLDMDCGDFMPFFILYNNNALNAWGYALNTKGGTSQRYEHPPLSAISVNTNSRILDKTRKKIINT